MAANSKDSHSIIRLDEYFSFRSSMCSLALPLAALLPGKIRCWNCIALHPAIDTGEIHATVTDGEVTLISGGVESPAVRQLVEALTEAVPGVKESTITYGRARGRERVTRHLNSVPICRGDYLCLCYPQLEPDLSRSAGRVLPTFLRCP